MNARELIQHPSMAIRLAKKELAVGRRLHLDVRATMSKLKERRPELMKRAARAYGFAVFPSVGRASAVLGCSYGLGEVFRRGRLIGYAGLVQLTLGVSVGGQTTSQVVLFQDRDALEHFRRGGVHLMASASAVAVKAAATAVTHPSNRGQSFIRSNGGLMLEAAAGVQRWLFAPAVLTRGRMAAAA